MQMNESEPTINLNVKDVVRAIVILEDAIDVLLSSTKMFIAQKNMYCENNGINSADGKVSLKNIENGIETLKAKIKCRQFFLKDFKERINETGIDIDAEVEKYKKVSAGE